MEEGSVFDFLSASERLTGSAGQVASTAATTARRCTASAVTA